MTLNPFKWVRQRKINSTLAMRAYVTSAIEQMECLPQGFLLTDTGFATLRNYRAYLAKLDEELRQLGYQSNEGTAVINDIMNKAKATTKGLEK